MAIRQEIAKRLRGRRNELNLSASEVSDRMPSKPIPARYSHWESGRSLPKIEQLIEIAHALKVSPSWVCGFTADMRDPNADTRLFTSLEDAHISLPTGEMVSLPTERSLQFNIEELEARGLKPERLILLKVGDESMAPVLCEDDLALIDREQRTPEGRDLFAMLVRNKVWFRWIRRELDGSFTVTAEDADAQHPTRIEADKLETLCIIGRVTNITRYR